MIFLDTSVLVAGAQATHPHNARSRAVLASIPSGKGMVAAHTLAELYASVTAMPPPERISPRTAISVLEAYLRKLTSVALTSEEYLATIRDAAKNGLAGGKIYDALLLACARKVNAERIYTWNLKHFLAVAPDLADRIMVP